MQLGIDSFLAAFFPTISARPDSGIMALAEMLDRVELADQVGLPIFGIGEHHRAKFVNSAPAVILAAAAARTKRIRLTSVVTVLSTDDPVRVFQQFATLDLLSPGRAELVVGRGSAMDAYLLFGFDQGDYDALLAEKLHLRTHEFSHPKMRPLALYGVFIWVVVAAGTHLQARHATKLGGGLFRRAGPGCLAGMTQRGCSAADQVTNP